MLCPICILRRGVVFRTNLSEIGSHDNVLRMQINVTKYFYDGSKPETSMPGIGHNI